MTYANRARADRHALPRTVLRAAGVLALALGASWLVTLAVVDAAFVEARLTEFVRGELGPHDVRVGTVDVRVLEMALTLDSVRIEPAASRRDAPQPEAPTIALVVPRAKIDGVGLLALAGGAFEAERVRISDARLDVEVESGERRSVVRLGGLDVELRNLAFGHEGPGRARPAAVAALRRVRFDTWRVGTPDGRQGLELTDGELSLETGEARTGWGRLYETRTERYVPDGSEGGPRSVADTTELIVDGLAARGLRYDTTGSAPLVRAGSLVLERPRVSVVDGVVPKDTGGPGSGPFTPVQRLRSLPARARVDSVVIRDGRVLYRERRPGYRAAGELRFEGLAGTARRLQVGPGPGSAEPMEVELFGRLDGEAPVWLTMGFPAAGERFSFEADAVVSNLDLTRLNSIFRPVEGIHIQDGRLDSLAFHLRVRDGRGRGTVVPHYADLDLSLEDPTDGESGVVEGIKEFVLGLSLNEENLAAEGESFRAGRVEYEIAPGDSFFQVLWNALLAGLRDVADV